MAQGSSTKILGLVGLLGVTIGLLWWLGRDGAQTQTPEDPTTSPVAEQTVPEALTPKPEPRRRSDIDPWTAPKAVVMGTVRDEKDQPIAGAQVCAKLEDRSLPTSSREPHCVTTRDDGTYRVEGLLGAEHNLFASARGYLPTRHRSRRGIQNMQTSQLDLVAGMTRKGVDFVLKRGGVEVKGVIKDIAGGVIEDAWVSAGDGWWNGQGATFAKSDENGGFALWVEAPEVRINARAEGYSNGTREAAVPGTFIEVFLTPESVVVGKVVWADTGKAVAGATISASAGWWNQGSSTLSGEDGTFRLEGLEPGAYKLNADDEELLGLAEQKVHVGLGETSESVVVKVHHAFSVRGTVLVESETPCSYGTVRLKDKRRTKGYGSGSRGHEDGSVLVEGLLPGTYEVTVSCQGYVPDAKYEDLVITDASIEGLQWSVSEGQTIRGIVVDAKGEPVAQARVSGRAKADKDPRAQRINNWGGRTEADGRFELSGLLPATYELSAYHDKLPSPEKPIEVELTAGADIDDFRIEMPASGRVEGTVRDEKGEVVADVSVQLRGSNWGGTARTSDEGRFVLEHVKTGEYRISARRGWMETIRAPGATDDDTAGERIDVKTDETTTIDLLVESQNGRITGRVLGEGGEPIPDAFVEAVRESDSAAASEANGRQRARWGSWSDQPLLTDEEGYFELTDLTEGASYSIYANRKGGGEAIAEHVAEGTDVELSIAEVGLLAGVVNLAGGGHPERFTVSINDRSAGVSEDDRFLKTEGRWELSNLPPGKYEINVDSPDGNGKVEVELGDGEEKTDVALTLTPRVTVHGQLVDSESGKGIPGLKVSVNAAGNNIMMFGVAGKADEKDISDADGNFVVENAPTGRVSLVVMSPGFTDSDYSWTWIARRLPTEPPTQDLGTIQLVKRRVGPGEEKGELGFKVKESEPDTEPEDRRIVVAFVKPKGPAAKAGLKVGDEVVAVDGQDVRGLESYRYGTLTTALPGTVIEFSVEREAAESTVKLTVGPPA